MSPVAGDSEVLGDADADGLEAARLVGHGDAARQAVAFARGLGNRSCTHPAGRSVSCSSCRCSPARTLKLTGRSGECMPSKHGSSTHLQVGEQWRQPTPNSIRVQSLVLRHGAIIGVLRIGLIFQFRKSRQSVGQPGSQAMSNYFQFPIKTKRAPNGKDSHIGLLDLWA